MSNITRRQFLEDSILAAAAAATASIPMPLIAAEERTVSANDKITAAIIGGFGRVLGPIVGAMIFWMILAFTDNVLRQAVDNDYLPKSVIDGVQVGQVRFMLVGLGLMLLMVFRPQGVFGDRREIAIDARR